MLAMLAAVLLIGLGVVALSKISRVASPRAVRWCGIVTILAGTVLVVSLFLLPASLDLDGSSPLSPRHYLIAFLPILLTPLSLGGPIGLHALQASRYGLLGMAGLSMVFFGDTLSSLLYPVLVIASGPAPDAPIIVSVVFLVLAYVVGPGGLTIQGVATLRAKVLPFSWRVLPLALGVFSLVLPLLRLLLFYLAQRDAWFVVADAPGILFGVGWALLGYALWRAGSNEGGRGFAPTK